MKQSIIIILILAIGGAGVSLFFSPLPLHAETTKPPTIAISLGDFSPQFGSQQCDPGGTCPINWLSQYIAALYNYGIALAGALAVIMIMVGGFFWLTSAGSPQRVGTAKEFITSAILGLLLALFSYTILNTINPRLTTLQTAGLTVPATPTPSNTGVSMTGIANSTFQSFRNSFLATLSPEQIAAGAGDIQVGNFQVHGGNGSINPGSAAGSAYFTYDITQTPDIRRFLQQNAELRTSAPLPGIPDFINNLFFSTPTAFYYYQGAIYRFTGTGIIHVWANPVMAALGH